MTHVLCVTPRVSAFVSSVRRLQLPLHGDAQGDLADPPSTHPSLPAIPAAAQGLAAHPQNMDSTGREDKGEFISRCE